MRDSRYTESTVAQLILFIREDSAGDQRTLICIVYELDECFADKSVLNLNIGGIARSLGWRCLNGLFIRSTVETT